VGDDAELERLGEQLALARRVVDNVPGMLAYWDRHQCCQFANAAYERWFGVKPETLIGKTLQELLGPIYPRNLPYITGALRGEAQVFEREIPDPTGGPSRHSQAHYVPDIVNGVVRGFVVMVSDVSELKRTQAEMLAAQRWAAVGTLAAGVAHEINTPIQFVSDNIHFLAGATRHLLALIGRLQRLRDLVIAVAPAAELAQAAAEASKAEQTSRLSFLEQELPGALGACTDGLERVGAIVESLKEFAQPAGEDQEPADINRAIEQTLALAVNEYRHIAELELLLGDLPSVVCHISDVRQVVLSLVVNAAHAIADVAQGKAQHGVIRVKTCCEEQDVVIEIGDTGTGIPEHVQSRVFEPFFTTKELGRGTGQGLAIAWSIVTQRHRGSLSFESTLGKGTTFRVRLPVSGQALPATGG
jgi:PAS domain S-box-containing protein